MKYEIWARDYYGLLCWIHWTESYMVYLYTTKKMSDTNLGVEKCLKFTSL